MLPECVSWTNQYYVFSRDVEYNKIKGHLQICSNDTNKLNLICHLFAEQVKLICFLIRTCTWHCIEHTFWRYYSVEAFSLHYSIYYFTRNFGIWIWPSVMAWVCPYLRACAIIFSTHVHCTQIIRNICCGLEITSVNTYT